MIVALHDADAEHFKTIKKFPNYALMGVPNSKLFIYCLITDDLEDTLTRVYAMRKLKSVTLYGMPYKDMRKGIMPLRWQNVMAQKYIYSGQWRKIDWDQWKREHEFYFKESDT